MLGGLVIATVGMTWLTAGMWPRTTGDSPVSARAWERASWRALWWPIVPVIAASSTLFGWAIMEPAESDEHLPSSAVLLSALFVGIWLRAGIRAIGALTVRRPYLAGTVGLWRPRVVLSEQLRRQVDADAWQAVQAHEAAHVRHRDPLRIWLAQLLTDLQWPGAAAHHRFQQWRHVLELARDEEARLCGADGADLAAAVLVAARLQTPSATGASLIESRSGLEERVARLLAPVPTDVVPTDSGASTVLTLLAVSVLGVLSGVRFGEAVVQAVVRYLP